MNFWGLRGKIKSFNIKNWEKSRKLIKLFKKLFKTCFLKQSFKLCVCSLLFLLHIYPKTTQNFSPKTWWFSWIFTTAHRDMQTHMMRHKSTRKTLDSTKKTLSSCSLFPREKIPLNLHSRHRIHSPSRRKHALTASSVIVNHLCFYCLSILFRSIFSRLFSVEKLLEWVFLPRFNLPVLLRQFVTFLEFLLSSANHASDTD